MIKIKGKIVGETNRALQLEVTEDEHSQLTGKSIWFPKSQIRLDEKEICISISEWLHEAKANEEKEKE